MACGCKSSKSLARPKNIIKKSSPSANGRRGTSGRIIKRIIK